MKKLKNNNLFFDSLRYVAETKNFIYFIIAFFIVFSVLGFLLAPHLSFIDSILKELINKTQDLRGFELVSFIFWNNIQSAFYGMILGIFFGVFSLFNAVSNGLVLGYVFNKVYAVSGFSDIWRILPHGIFELPAIFIALGLGLKIGFFVFSKKPLKTLLERVRKSVYSFIFIVLPLLIVAAVIEGILITVSG